MKFWHVLQERADGHYDCVTTATHADGEFIGRSISVIVDPVYAEIGYLANEAVLTERFPDA